MVSECELMGDFIESSVVERHAQLMREFAAGVSGMCIALWSIRGEQTFKAQGFATWTDFLKSIGMGVGTGRLYANAGPLLVELRKTGHDALIGHVDVLRPVALLLAPKQSPERQRAIIERQALIVRTAAAVAKRGQEPLTETVIARVAKANFGILPRAEYQAARRKAKPVDERKEREKLKTDLELALVLIGSFGSGHALAEQFGDARVVTGFTAALRAMQEWEAS
jgi:hypothetical protein